MQVIFLLIVVAIFADIVILTIMAMRVSRGVEKIEMFCDTFEQVTKNVLEDHLNALSKVAENCKTSEDHLKTINKNIYLMARKILGKEEEDKE